MTSQKFLPRRSVAQNLRWRRALECDAHQMAPWKLETGIVCVGGSVPVLVSITAA